MEFFFLNINQRKKIREVYNERKRSGKYDHLFMNRIKKNCNKWNSRIPNQKKKKKNSNQLQKKLVDHMYHIQKVLIIKKQPKHQLERTKTVSKHSQVGQQAYKNMSNLMTNQEVSTC